MKKYINIIKLLFVGFVATSMSCVSEGVDAIEGKGSSFVRLPAASEDINIFGVDLLPGDKTSDFVEIIRDVTSQSELNTAATVKLKVDDALITAYNTANKTTFVPLPTNLYKLSETEVQLAAGQFNKVVKLTFDPTKLDQSKKYALGITVDNAGNYKVRNGLGSALYQIIAKNKYHGRYKALGVFSHPTAGDREINRIKDLITVNENTVSAELGDLGGAGYSMLLKVNADNSVTVTPSGVTPNIDQSYSKNYYDPATKSFHLHYSYNVAAPRIVKEVISLQ